MLDYVLIGLSLALAGVVGMQLAFGIYHERLDKERKRRLAQLEKKCRAMARRLSQADRRIAELEMQGADSLESIESEDNWADVIDDN